MKDKLEQFFSKPRNVVLVAIAFIVVVSILFGGSSPPS
jgi:preprotein translocase subunit Sec61beta